MFSILAAAAAVAVSPAGDAASVRVNIAGVDRAEARAEIRRAAVKACRAIDADTDLLLQACVGDAVQRAVRDYDRVAQRTVTLAAR